MEDRWWLVVVVEWSGVKRKEQGAVGRGVK